MFGLLGMLQVRVWQSNGRQASEFLSLCGGIKELRYKVFLQFKYVDGLTPKVNMMSLC